MASLSLCSTRPSSRSRFSVPFFYQGDPVVGSPSLLFQVDLKSNVSRHYDTLDGQTFVVNLQVHDQDATPLTLVVNAFDEGP